MASIYKTISRDDVASVKTKLHEAIPVTGSIVSGTYTSDSNIKNYGHQMFQSVYDYPYLSSSANHLFDISLGVASTSSIYSNVTNQQQKKLNIYTQMAQLLAGYNSSGSARPFDRDGLYASEITRTNNITEAAFVNFSRLLTKDEIQKGTFSMEFMVSSGYTSPRNSTVRLKLFDSGALDNYKVNSPVGEYGLLYVTNSAGAPVNGTAKQAGSATAIPAGLVFYQAGIAVVDAALFTSLYYLSSSVVLDSTGNTSIDYITGSTIQSYADAFRSMIYNVSFNNTTELNSTIYFCRVGHNEFNYSSNPTYLSSSKIVVKENATDTPVSYFTTVGLYSADNELLAVAKLSEPLKKDPTQNYTLRVRLDY
jgi:hypothetical protein